MFLNFSKFLKITYLNNKFEIIVFCILIFFSTSIDIYQFNHWETNSFNYPYIWASNTDTPDGSWGGLLSGDEPNYLVVTSTLINHNSVNLVDFYHSSNRDTYLTFPERFYSHTPTISNDWQGWKVDAHHVYSIHEPGLSVLMIPGYFFGGILGAMITTSLIFSLTGVYIYKFSSKIVNNKISFFTTLIFFLGTILFSFAGAIYPDAVVSFFLILILYLFFFKKHNYPNLIFIGSLLGFIVFLKVTFIILPVIIIPIFTMFLIKSNHKNLIFSLILPLIFILFIFSLYNYSLFEEPKMLAGYHGNLDRLLPKSSVMTSNVENISENFLLIQIDRISTGLLNYLFGPTYGLFIFSPLALISFLGFSSFWKNNKSISVTFFSIFLGFLLVMAWGQFPGGAWSLPSRYILPIIPLLVIPLAYLIKDYSKNIFLYAVLSLVLVLGITFNSIFSNIIHSHISTFDRSSIMKLVYGPFSEIFPYPNDVCYRCTSEYIIGNTNPFFWIFLSFLLVVIILITLKNYNIKAINSLLIVFVIVLLMLPSSILAGIFYDDYKISSSIHSYYIEFLKREPDSFELAEYKTQFLENGKTLEWIEQDIKNSQEAKYLNNNAELERNITEYYIKYLHRTPDLPGLIYFKTQFLENGKTLEWIEQAIKNSEEAKSLS